MKTINKPLTLSEVKEIIDKFAALCRDCPGLVKSLEDEIHMCDQAAGDIVHYIEFNQSDRTKASQLTREIKKYRIQRRKAKDFFSVISPLARFVEKHRPMLGELERTRGDIKKALEHAGNDRQYNPRVLYELFGRDQPVTAMSMAASNVRR